MITRLVWLRNDLRITDNKALYAACRDPDVKILAVFIATPKQWQQHTMSSRQATFIYENLLEVQRALAERGIALIYHQCPDFDASIKWLCDYCMNNKINEIYYNRQYELNERKRDEQLEHYLGNKVICKSFDDSVLIPPGSILNTNLSMYKIYTPFRKIFIQRLQETNIQPLPAPKIRQTGPITIKKVPLPFDYPSQSMKKTFPPGEKTALKRLNLFCKNKIHNYVNQRNFPASEGTSGLSPYLAIGVLSPRQCISKLFTECPNLLEKIHSDSFCWLNELIWREFYRHLIAAYPFLCMNKPFIHWTHKIHWHNDNKLLQAWIQGLTGYPLVDAAMRQLNTIGWMHNRLRMVTASFLVKDLLIDWRIGEKYFMLQLIDGDFAANNGGWQWAASTGNDPVPYFRIFNPITQSKRFDPHGTFIRKWLPELRDVPDNYIHNPASWIEKNKGLSSYPPPIVDHMQARQNALAAFEAAKSQLK